MVTRLLIRQGAGRISHQPPLGPLHNNHNNMMHARAPCWCPWFAPKGHSPCSPGSATQSINSSLRRRSASPSNPSQLRSWSWTPEHCGSAQRACCSPAAQLGNSLEPPKTWQYSTSRRGDRPPCQPRTAHARGTHTVGLEGGPPLPRLHPSTNLIPSHWLHPWGCSSVPPVLPGCSPAAAPTNTHTHAAVPPLVLPATARRSGSLKYRHYS